MPKMKTHSATKKRFSLTGSGKLRRNRAFRSHLLEHEEAQAQASPAQGHRREPIATPARCCACSAAARTRCSAGRAAKASARPATVSRRTRCPE